MQNEEQYNLDRKAAKISALLETNLITWSNMNFELVKI